jgi:hypothetical protein
MPDWADDKARLLFGADAAKLTLDMVAQALRSAHEKGRNSVFEILQVQGTDGCRSCETGRVTMYVFSRNCLQCQHREETPSTSQSADTCPGCGHPWSDHAFGEQGSSVCAPKQKPEEVPDTHASDKRKPV